MKIDCSITENYLREKTRMTKNCGIRCIECPFHGTNTGREIPCGEFEINYPAEAIAIVQKWSDEHPVMTNKEKFVQIMKDVFGVEVSIGKNECPPTVCFFDKCNSECSKCMKWWDELYKEPEKKEG